MTNVEGCDLAIQFGIKFTETSPGEPFSFFFYKIFLNARYMGLHLSNYKIEVISSGMSFCSFHDTLVFLFFFS